MRRIGYFVALVLIWASVAPGQSKRVWLLGSVAAYSTFDYLGYNLTKNGSGRAPTYYRIIQFGVQGAITYFLGRKVGWDSMVSFNLVWWTFGNDLLYYKVAELFPDGRFEGRGTWGSLGEIHHAHWTPLGMMHGDLSKGQVIGQSMIGLTLALSL